MSPPPRMCPRYSTFPPAQIPGHINAPFGTGLTAQEAADRDIAYARNSNVYEAQDFAPRDPDPNRMYMVRGLDGNWALHNRVTIESGDLGEYTWYMDPTKNNAFYVVIKEKEGDKA